MQDNEIKNLLENIEVQPSARCWQAIESQLTVGTAASGAAATSAQAAGHAGWLSTTVAKVVIGAVAAVAVATGIVLATYSSKESESVEKQSVAPATAQVVESTEVAVPAAEALIVPPVPAIQGTAVTSDVAEQDNPIVELTEPAPANVSPITPAVAPKQSQTSNSTANSAGSGTRNTASIATVTPVKPTTAPQTIVPAAQPASVATSETTASDYSDPLLESWNESESIFPAEPVRIEIPNVITPNGDGYNDFFVISGIENCDQTKLIIRSRSGATIFQVNNYANNWDANNVPTGTYYYQFYYTIHGIQEIRTGTLTILR